MNKHINVIVYQPGHGGRFIKHLLSMHDSTYFWKSLSITSSSRKDHLSYKDIYTKFGSWASHHNSFIYGKPEIQHFHGVLTQFTNSNYDILNLDMHPVEYYRYSQHNGPLSDSRLNQFDVTYFKVTMSQKYEYVIDQFRQFNQGFPKIKVDQHSKWSEFINNHNVEPIDFDRFIQGEDSFLREYTRLCPLFNVPVDTATALELYRDWYAERQFAKFLK